MTAFCTHCGSELPDGAQFCANCGAPVDSAGQAAVPQAPTEAVEGQLLKEVRTWAMLCHLSTFSGGFIPFGNILGPLIIWLMKREESPFIDAHGKEALNWQISATIYFVVCFALVFVLIGFVLLPALLVFDIIIVIIATVRANSGQAYRYPMTIRFIK